MDHPTIPLSEVAKHKGKDDCWLVIHGKILDVTRFLEDHPGGDEVLLDASGKDATEQFDDIGHSDHAKSLLDEYLIGFLEGFVADAVDESSNFSTLKPQIEKGESTSRLAILRYILPVVILGIAFALRFLKMEEGSVAP